MSRVARTPKPLQWMGSSRKDLKGMPEGVKDAFGFALHLAQIGDIHLQAKPLRGFGSAGVLEVVENWDRSTYRAVYTVRFSNAIYVLHCFQKKSTYGAETPKPDLELIRTRLKDAEKHSRGYSHGKDHKRK
jgi:phage-related protein